MSGTSPDLTLPTVPLREPYRPRRAHFLELWRPDGWLVKLYGIAYKGETPPAAAVEAGKHAAARVLPQPARGDDRYGVAFVIVHQGQDACWLLTDWWGYESVLHHRLLVAPLTGERRFEPASPDVTACVWELPLLLFERDAWVAAVMTDDEAGPDVSRYLDYRFDGSV